MTLQFHYYDPWKGAPLNCAECGWSGSLDANHTEMRDQLLDFDCPLCDTTLAIISYPTTNEVHQAARRGHPEAARQQQRARSARPTLKLESSEQLPSIDGGSLRFQFDAERDAGQVSYVIRLGDLEIWREPAGWEDWPRFNAIKDLFKHRYGDAFARMEPTGAAKATLFGDDREAAKNLQLT